MYGGRTTSHQVARSKALDDYVAQATSCDVREPARFQRHLVQLARRHTRRPQVQERFGLVYESKSSLELGRVGIALSHVQPTIYGYVFASLLNADRYAAAMDLAVSGESSSPMFPIAVGPTLVTEIAPAKSFK